MKNYADMTREELTAAQNSCTAILTTTRQRIRLGLKTSLAAGANMNDVLDFYRHCTEEIAAVRNERNAILAALKTR